MTETIVTCCSLPGQPVPRLGLGSESCPPRRPIGRWPRRLTMNTNERRRHRSAVRSEALVLLLEACRERTGLEALVISDRDGLLVSSSARTGVDPEDVAAHLPSTHLRDQVPSLRAFTFKM